MSKPHFHKTESGILMKCYHKTKSVLWDYGFWIGVTVSFPIEHFIWEKLEPFASITRFIGL